MAGNKGASGVMANLRNRTFELALGLSHNPGMVLTPKSVAADMGLSNRQAQQVCRQLIAGEIAERIGHGRYRETVGLRRMVALWAPEKAACCMDGLEK